jgi:hypothetical protein
MAGFAQELLEVFCQIKNDPQSITSKFWHSLIPKDPTWLAGVAERVVLIVVPLGVNHCFILIDK